MPYDKCNSIHMMHTQWNNHKFGVKFVVRNCRYWNLPAIDGILRVEQRVLWSHSAEILFKGSKTNIKVGDLHVAEVEGILGDGEIKT